MRHLAAFAVLPIMSLASCGTLASGGLDPGVTDQLATAITAIQQSAVVGCGFLPDVATVNSIIKAKGKGGIGTTTLDIAGTVCQLVLAKAPNTAIRGFVSTVPVYPGTDIPIKGEFIR